MKANSTEKIVKPDYTRVKVGDYMLKDGTTVNPDEMNEEQKSQAIGIVAYLYEVHRNVFLKDGVKTALESKEIENPHGIVIALENARDKEEYEWSKKSYHTIENKSLNEKIFYGLDGLEMTNNLKNIEDYPAFQAAKDYEKEVPAPENTTGWYLPSVGEWFCMLDNYKEFSKYISHFQTFWTSTEDTDNNAYSVRLYSFGGFYYEDYNRKNTFFIRPILAF